MHLHGRRRAQLWALRTSAAATCASACCGVVCCGCVLVYVNTHFLGHARAHKHNTYPPIHTYTHIPSPPPPPELPRRLSSGRVCPDKDCGCVFSFVWVGECALERDSHTHTHTNTHTHTQIRTHAHTEERETEAHRRARRRCGSRPFPT